MLPQRSAFTLIELLIVVAIIAILAAIAVPNFLEAQVRSKVSRAKADIRSMTVGIESYAVDNNTYPYTESIGDTIWIAPGGRPRSNAEIPAGITTPIAYLTQIPIDPFEHPDTDEVTLQPKFVKAPLYFERAGFGYRDGVRLNNKPVHVPADAVGTNSLVGIGPDTPVTDPRLTPTRYVLYSIGPDLTPHMVDANGAIMSRSRFNLGNRYDPTNGSVSTGNIVRFADAAVFP